MDSNSSYSQRYTKYDVQYKKQASPWDIIEANFEHKRTSHFIRIILYIPLLAALQRDWRANEIATPIISTNSSRQIRRKKVEE